MFVVTDKKEQIRLKHLQTEWQAKLLKAEDMQNLNQWTQAKEESFTWHFKTMQRLQQCQKEQNLRDML